MQAAFDSMHSQIITEKDKEIDKLIQGILKKLT
jgi:hypothetical protein